MSPGFDSPRVHHFGGVREWFNRAVSKTAMVVRPSKVRILPPPPMFNFFKKEKKEPKNLKEVLVCLENLEKNFKSIFQEIENFKKENKFSIQKLGIVRFNPFSEVGSDQSFSIALLDGNDNGIVITSLYTREENRVYGKPIKAGLSEYSLSVEEKEAIDKAKNRK